MARVVNRAVVVSLNRAAMRTVGRRPRGRLTNRPAAISATDRSSPAWPSADTQRWPPEGASSRPPTNSRLSGEVTRSRRARPRCACSRCPHRRRARRRRSDTRVSTLWPIALRGFAQARRPSSHAVAAACRQSYTRIGGWWITRRPRMPSATQLDDVGRSGAGPEHRSLAGLVEGLDPVRHHLTSGRGWERTAGPSSARRARRSRYRPRDIDPPPTARRERETPRFGARRPRTGATRRSTQLRS